MSGKEILPGRGKKGSLAENQSVEVGGPSLLEGRMGVMMAMMYHEESKGWRECVDKANQCFETARLNRSSASSRVQGNLAELDCWRTSTIFDMFQLKLLESNRKVSKIQSHISQLW